MYAIEKLDPNYDPAKTLEVFDAAAYVVRWHRPWFYRQYNKYTLHPIVLAAMKLCRPHDWHQLLLEWPHRSDNDPNTIAFTRDDRGGEADRVVTTSMGKYISRHFPMPDHYVRDLVALHTQAQDKLMFVHTTDEMIHHIQNGPRSCMQWEHADPSEHPYQVYDPKYGWHMAVRIESDGMTCGRALCYALPDGSKFFVRSYDRNRSGGYSQADYALETWLKQQGYEHRSSWEGCKLAYIKGNPFLAPYLDGGAQGVYVVHDAINGDYLHVVQDDHEDVEWLCNSTGGDPEHHNAGEPCADCDELAPDGDQYWVGVYEDRMVCYHCRESNYTHARSRYGRWRWIENDEVVYVESTDTHYDVNHVGDNEIVELHDGDYEHVDNCVEIDGEYYRDDDDNIVQLAGNNGEYALLDDCVEINGEYYREDDDNIVEVGGTWYRKSEDYIVECDDGEYRLKDDCFQCPACDAWHARELIEA